MTEPAGPEERQDGAPAVAHEALDEFDRGARQYVEGKPEAAVDHFDAALRIEPDLGDVHYMRGLALLRLGRVDDGLDALRRAVETTDNHILRDYAERKIASVSDSTAAG